MEKGKMIAQNKAKKSSILIIVLLGFFLVLLSASGVFAWKLFLSKPQDEETPRENAKQRRMIGPVYPLDTFIVNLADQNRQRYIKVDIHLEMDNPRLELELNERYPQIQDTIIQLLSMQRYDDVTSHRGKSSLRSEIVRRINEFLVTGSIQGIYFTDFLTQ